MGYQTVAFIAYLSLVKVAVHSRGPRKHCVISLRTYSKKKKKKEICACAWGQNNLLALHSTVFIRRLRLRELLWSAGTHGKGLPSNDECRARRSVQRDGSPYAFYERNYFDVQAIEESMRRRKNHNENYVL